MELPSHTYRCICGEGMHIEPFEAGRLTHCPRCRDFIIIPSELGALAKQPIFDLSTTRLHIQLATTKNWREIHEINSDDRNYDYEISSPCNAKETKSILKKTSFPKGFYKSNQLQFIISTRHNGQIIGTFDLTFTFPYYCCYVGFVIKREIQGKGYGTEALSAVCQFLTGNLNVERVWAMCDEQNKSCRKVLEKVGFLQEGVSKKFFHHPERGWIDSSIYALLRE